VQDDTENSYDAPEWFSQELKSAQPPLTRPVESWRLGANKRVVLKPLVEVDPYGLSGPRELEPRNARAGFYPTRAERERFAGSGVVRSGRTETGSYGGGEQNPAARARRLAERERLGKTAAADYGRGEDAAFAGRPLPALPDALAATRAAAEGATRRTGGAVEDAALRATFSGSRFADEPPFRAYYAGAQRALPDGSCIVRPMSRAGVPSSTGNGASVGAAGAGASAGAGAGARPTTSGKVGHALFHALVNDFGSLPSAHLAAPVAMLRAQGAADATRSLMRSAPSGLFGTNELRRAPLNYYNAAR
jgi:hypothetical protein